MGFFIFGGLIYYVYLAHTRNHEVKIGFSKNPKRRIKELSREKGEDVFLYSTIAFQLKSEAFRVEQYFHSHLDQFSIGGEWYPSINYIKWVWEWRKEDYGQN